MATINRTGIVNGQISYADHVTRVIDALDGTSAATIVGTGSFTGSFKGTFTGAITSASFASTASHYAGSVATASYAARAVSSSISDNSIYAINSTFATTASFITLARSASYVANAQTSSLALRASGSLTGSLLGTASFATTASYAVTASYAITSPNIANTNLTLTADTVRVLSHVGSSRFIISGSSTSELPLFDINSSILIPSRLIRLQQQLNNEPNRIAIRSLSAGGTNKDDSAMKGWVSDYVIEYVSSSAVAPNQLKGYQWSVWDGSIYKELLILSSSGNVHISGSLNVDQGITGSLFGTASFTATASYAATASFVTLAQTASYVLNAVSASYAPPSVSVSASYAATATTASFVNVISTVNATNYSLVGVDSSNGTLIPEQLYTPGPTFNPDTNVLAVGGGTVSAGAYTTITPSSVAFQGTASWAVSASRAVSASIASTASYVAWAGVLETTTDTFSGTASFATRAATASFVTTAQTASYVLNAVSASYAPSLGGGTDYYLATGDPYSIPVGTDVIVYGAQTGGGSGVSFYLQTGSVTLGSKVQIIMGEGLSQHVYVQVNGSFKIAAASTVSVAGGYVVNNSGGAGNNGAYWSLVYTSASRWTVVGYSDANTISGTNTYWPFTFG